MGNVYFFPSSAMIYNDKVIPIVLELARQGNRVRTVFIDYQAYQNLRMSGPYNEWLRTFTHMRMLITKERWSLWDKGVFLCKFMYLMLEMRVAPGVAFFDTKGATWVTTILSRLAKRHGQSILVTALYADIWGIDIDWKKVTKDKAHRQRLGKSALSSPIEYKECSKILLYNEAVADHERDIGCSNFLTVPHPKLQSWWGRFVEDHPPVHDHPILNGTDPYVVVCLTHQGNYFFREDSDLDVLLNEIIACVRQVFSDMPILVKPKQTALRQQQWFSEYRRGLCDDRVFFVDTPVAMLASRALVGIMTGNSTAQFEFMVGEAPFIEYCRYSDFWKSLYPKQTYTLDYGGVWAQSPDELVAFLSQARNGTLKTDLALLKRRINFVEREISFDDFMAAV